MKTHTLAWHVSGALFMVAMTLFLWAPIALFQIYNFPTIALLVTIPAACYVGTIVIWVVYVVAVIGVYK